jgi:hypothetical protein
MDSKNGQHMEKVYWIAQPTDSALVLMGAGPQALAPPWPRRRQHRHGRLPHRTSLLEG